MNIPETAIQAAAAKLLNHTPPHWCPRCQGEDPFCPRCDRDAYELMEAALEAALPHIRKQIAADIRQSSIDMQEAADTFGVGTYSGTIGLKADGMAIAARIAEEGTTK